MGAVLGLLADVGIRAEVSASGSPSVATSVNTPDGGNVASIVNHPRLNLADARATLRKHAKSVIYCAFPERSRRATCHTAARAFGVSPDTIERMIEGDTANPCPLILGVCASMVRQRTGKPTAICKVLAQFVNAEITP